MVDFFPTDPEEHIARHKFDSPIMGSKPISEEAEKIMEVVLALTDAEFKKQCEAGNGGLTYYGLTTDQPYGTNAVVPNSCVKASRMIPMVREPGTPGEAEIYVVIVDPKDMPRTNIMHVIYGPYDDGVSGNYTLMFGDPGSPFPKKLPENATSEEIKENEEYKKYWNSHVFLVTPEEFEYALKKMEEHGIDTSKQRQMADRPYSNPMMKEPETKIAEYAVNLGEVKMPAKQAVRGFMPLKEDLQNG